MHLIQQRNHNFLKNRHFIYHGGIEDSIGLLLIRIDVMILSLLYILPEMNGILRTPAAKLIISGNAADQAVITCRYTVMLVQIQVRQCIDIDTKLRLFRQIGRGLRIQSVDTFYYQNMIILQHCFPFLPLALPRFEVEQRHMHCFLMQQLQHGVIKQLQIQCLQSFKIIASIRQPWTVLAVFIEIIH